jgi:oxygen-independent coproporphyrinogen-3 oxidase
VRRAGSGQGGAGDDASIGASSLILLKDLPFEFMLNALRLNEGFTVRDYRRRTGLEMATVEARLAEGQARGLLTSQADTWRPTELGRRFLNDLQGSFLA